MCTLILGNTLETWSFSVGHISLLHSLLDSSVHNLLVDFFEDVFKLSSNSIHVTRQAG